MGAINGEASEPVGFASYQLDAGTNLSCQVVQASPNLLSYLHVAPTTTAAAKNHSSHRDLESLVAARELCRPVSISIPSWRPGWVSGLMCRL